MGTPQKNKTFSSSGWLSREDNNYVTPIDKIKKLLFLLLPISLAIAIGFLTAKDAKYGVGLAAAFSGSLILVICMLNAEAGLYITLVYTFFVSYFDRLLFKGELTEGVGFDLLLVATFMGFLVRKVSLKKNMNELMKSSVFKLLLIVFIYSSLQLFNPYAGSFNGWVPAFRRIVGNFLLVLIANEALNSMKSIRRFIKVLFFVCVIVAIYGCIQEWHDFFDFELEWLRAENQRFIMTYVNGGARRISTLHGALELAIIMAMCGVLFTGLGILHKKLSYKIILITGVIFMLMAMSFALTRTSNVMYIGGLFLFLLITFDKLISKIATVSGLLFFLFILFGPIYNSHVGQFRNTFLGGTKDASYIVREVNRKAIQPYIYSHPFGGGLNTTGDEGKVYSPGHRLAGFPPDSGMLKKALEIGWIGFIMIMTMYFLILRLGIKGYFETKNLENKMIYASITAAFFALYLGDFSQIAVGQITDVIVYYPMLVVMLKLNNLKEEVQIRSLT